MNNIFKILAGVVVVVAIAGAYFYPKFSIPVGSTAGATFNSAKFAGVVANLSAPGTTGTTTSILNTDSGNRYVTGVRIACNGIGTSKTAYTGAGLAALTFTVGTSSTAGANTVGATATLLNGAIFATATPALAIASSTSSSGTITAAAIWHSGEYMSFQSNATNTAQCTEGVDYIGS